MKESGLSSTDIAGIQVIISINLLVSILFVRILGKKCESLTELVSKLAAINESLMIHPLRLKETATKQIKIALILLIFG